MGFSRTDVRKSVIDSAEREWSAKGFITEKESMTATVSAKNTKPSPLIVCEREAEKVES
jgi:hypothetical protein